MELISKFFQYFNFIGIFAVVFILIIVTLVTVLSICVFSNRKKNRNSPKLTVRAKVVSKRILYSKSKNFDLLDATCYVTFEAESGDRMELFVPYDEYGLLVEGNQGDLAFQGKMYINFTRH